MKASGPPHVLELWLVVRKGMLPVTLIPSNKSSFCVSQMSWKLWNCHVVVVNLTTLRSSVILPDLRQLCVCVCF